MWNPFTNGRSAAIGLAIHRLRFVLAGFAFAWLTILGFVVLTSAPQTYLLDSSRIEHDSGCAYTAPIEARPYGWPITQYSGDSVEHPSASKSRLLEDGKPVGTPHALHEAIRQSGRGDYSHWGPSLFFSTSDCTDPRSNGLRYAVSLEPGLSGWAKTLGLASAVGLLATLVRNIWGRPGFQRLLRSTARGIDFLVRPRKDDISMSWALAFFGALLLGGLAFLLWTWSTERSPLLALGGFYQVSDSMGYWLCSNALLDPTGLGHLFSVGQWCQRRAIYPTLLSGIVWVAQRNIFATLLLQAAVAMVAVYLIARRSVKISGIVGMVVCAGLLFLYATEYVFAQTMSENAGLIFGCLGFASLLVASERRSMRWLVLGVASMSIALNARAGAFFVLPALTLWACLLARSCNQRVWKWLTAAVIAAFSGFALQFALVAAVGGNFASSHGNFSYTLYGLSVGGKGWQQVLLDHPTLSGSDAAMSRQIYAWAWENILADPRSLLSGLSKNIDYYTVYGTYGFDRLGSWSLLGKTCWWLAWIPLWSRRRDPYYCLIALCSLAVLVAVPFLFGDGGARIFAATEAIDAMQVAIGCSWIVSFLVHRVLAVPQGSALQQDPIKTARPRMPLEMYFALFLLVIMFLPHLRWLHGRAPAPATTACVGHDYTLITRIGAGGTLLLNFVDDEKKVEFRKGEIRYKDFVRGIPPFAWWGPDVKDFSDSSLLLGYQQDASDPYVPGPYPVFSNRNLADFYGRTVRICIDRYVTKRLFGVEYRRLNSITVLE